jgi:uncharacterized protein (TIGR02596 family)
MKAFSLIEMLVVIAIVALLASMTLPAFHAVTSGVTLERGGQDVASLLALARENAIAKSRPVEIRLIKSTSSSGQTVYRGVQPWIVKDDSGTFKPLGRLTWLPDAVAITEQSQLSPMFGANVQVGTMTVAGSNCAYVSFGFRPNGSLVAGTNLISSTNSCLTVVAEKDLSSSGTPQNFYSIYINPTTGDVRTFRP